MCVYINLLHAAQYFILSCINYTSLSPSHSNEEITALNTSSFAEDSLIRLTAFSSSSVQQQRISINYAHLTLTICTILTIANQTLNKNCSHFHIKSTLQHKQKQKTVYPFGRFSKETDQTDFIHLSTLSSTQQRTTTVTQLGSDNYRVAQKSKLLF